MAVELESEIQRWVEAKLIDAGTAERIRSFEISRTRTTRNWPMLIAISFGTLMLGAGILLFVAAHWEEMSPASRFELVLLMLAVLHLAGVLTAKGSPQLSLAMHAVGTIACGAGIFLTGQIFNLQEHWPTGVLLWALASWIGWALLRHWSQLALAALLTPAWLLSEWEEATKRFSGGERIAVEGTLLLVIIYLTARSFDLDSPIRRALNWIGGIALIPAYLVFALIGSESYWFDKTHLPLHLHVLGWMVAILGPLAIAFLLRRFDAWPAALAAIWVVVFAYLPFGYHNSDVPLFVYAWHTLGPYLWGALGSIGLIAWGLRDRVKNRVNLGMVVFVVTLICFYFSDLLDKLGRSVSLISFGILFLVIGYFLEKTRKRLIAQIGQANA